MPKLKQKLGYESIPCLNMQDIRYLQALCSTIIRDPVLRKRFVDERYQEGKTNRSTIIRCEIKLRDYILKNRLVVDIDITPTKLKIASQSEKIDIKKHG